MFNYKRVVCEVAVSLVLLAVVTAAPAADCTHPHYDQRQTGTENHRWSIDGLVIAIAPAESLLEAASGLSHYFGETNIEILFKPEENSKPEPEKPPSDVNHVTDLSTQKKDVSSSKNEKAQRLKDGVVNSMLPV